MLTFSLADLFEVLADAVPDRIALATSAGTRYTYRQMDERGNRLAHVLTAHGVTRGDRVAVVAGNRVEWADALLACFKIGVLPVNVNYRYTPLEVSHVLRDAEPVVVLVEGRYLPAIRQALADLPYRPDVVILADEGEFRLQERESRYDSETAAAHLGRGFLPRSGSDGYLLYTGGTTGMPKGVRWTHENLLFGALAGAGFEEPIGAPAEILRHAEHLPEARMAMTPLMHGNGQWAVLRAWTTGGTAVLWTGRSFDPEAIWSTVEREHVAVITVVGDVMARPLVETLDAYPARWDLHTLNTVMSGGAVLSADVKRALTGALPGITVLDGYGASEIGTGGTTTDRTETGQASFSMRPGATVLDDDLRECPVGQVGLMAASRHIPEGYWRNERATAAVFRVDEEGTRWAVPGDHAVRNEDGTVTVLGRGSLCINTGGEKVFPDEVETVLKTHASVLDAVVVGVPDDDFGEQIAAVVALRPGQRIALAELQNHVRARLAGYKVPRRLATVEAVRRSPAGKADYTWARDLASNTQQETHVKKRPAGDQPPPRDHVDPCPVGKEHLR